MPYTTYIYACIYIYLHGLLYAWLLTICQLGCPSPVEPMPPGLVNVPKELWSEIFRILFPEVVSWLHWRLCRHPTIPCLTPKHSSLFNSLIHCHPRQPIPKWTRTCLKRCWQTMMLEGLFPRLSVVSIKDIIWQGLGVGDHIADYIAH